MSACNQVKSEAMLLLLFVLLASSTFMCLFALLKFCRVRYILKLNFKELNRDKELMHGM